MVVGESTAMPAAAGSWRRVGVWVTAAFATVVLCFGAAKAAGVYLHDNAGAYVAWAPSGATTAIVVVVRLPGGVVKWGGGRL